MGDNRKKGKQIDFIVNTGDPSSSAANKKRVRSVAALKSWPERRRKIFAQLENSGSGHGAFLVNEPEREPKRKTKPAKQNAEGNAQETGRIAGPPKPPKPPALQAASVRRPVSSTPARGRMVPNLDPELAWKYSPEPVPGSSLALYHDCLARVPATAQAVTQLHALLQGDQCHCAQCRQKQQLLEISPTSSASSTEIVAPASKKRRADGTEKEASESTAMIMLTPPRSPASDQSPSNGKCDPFNCYPVPYQPWFDKVLYHMMTIYAPRGWPSLKITDEQGVKWEWFMTQNALSEPALFYVRLLFGSGEMIRLGGLRAEIQLWLRSQAIKCINEALNDPTRSCSDSLILAIGRIALHEHMYGDKYASSHVHRPAQKRMIDMRGGMAALEIPELVKRLMRWSDRIMAVGSGTPRLLEDDGPDSNFTLRQSVDAIERWTPQHMPQVRSVIKISDLVNDDEEGS